MDKIDDIQLYIIIYKSIHSRGLSAHAAGLIFVSVALSQTSAKGVRTQIHGHWPVYHVIRCLLPSLRCYSLYYIWH